MDRVKPISRTTPAPDITPSREKYAPMTWDGNIDDDSERGSSEVLEDKGLVFLRAMGRKRSRVLDRSLAAVRSVTLMQILVGGTLLFTSIVSIIYLAEHIPSKPSTALSPSPPAGPGSKRMALEKPCGEDAAEARARGCRFDVMGFLWLPEQCYDQELIDEFVAMREWRFFTDKNKTELVSMEQAKTGEYPILYVSHEYHVRHCTLIWRKMHRALLAPDGLASVDGYMGNYGHTMHCEHMLIDWKDRPLELINTGLVRQFPSCGMFAR